MSKNSYLFTSESVSEGHPDKIADQISDAILDEALKQDKDSKVAVEVFTTTGLVLIGGEITTKANLNIKQIAKETLKEIGYTNEAFGLSAESCSIQIVLDEQSKEIAQAVNKEETTAGDQGIMFGYATNETKEYMPTAIAMAHDLTKTYSAKRKAGILKWSRPDMKSQVTIEYINNKPKRIDTILISAQHDEETTQEKIKQDLIKEVIVPVYEKYDIESAFETKIIINPSGKFTIGGSQGDTGLTGRKIIADTYGGYARHGGGAFSGKDPSKVDRSAAYMSRYIAKNIVAANLADEIEIQLSYAIGRAEPISIYLTGKNFKEDKEIIKKAIEHTFDMTPQGMIDTLKLKEPIYKSTASYGHFGREDLKLPWEELDKKEELLKTIKEIKNEH